MVIFMSSAQCESWCEVKFLGPPGRVGFPAAARRATPMKLPRAEPAFLAPVAQELRGVAMHQVAQELEVATLLGRLRAENLHFQQPVDAEESGIASHVVAH